MWLCENNELYQNVVIDQEAIESLPEDDIPDRFMQENVVVAMESEDLGNDNARNDRVAYVDSNSGSNLSFDQASQMCISELILLKKDSTHWAIRSVVFNVLGGGYYISNILPNRHCFRHCLRPLCGERITSMNKILLWSRRGSIP
jgi:hypothetical protein